jgi:hypothetical protein
MAGLDAKLQRIRRRKTLKDVQISTLVPSSTTRCGAMRKWSSALTAFRHEGVDPFPAKRHLRLQRGNRYLAPDEEGSIGRIASDLLGMGAQRCRNIRLRAKPKRNATHSIPADSSSTVMRAAAETRGKRSVAIGLSITAFGRWEEVSSEELPQIS